MSAENECDLDLVPCWFDRPHSPHDRFNAGLRVYVHCPGLALILDEPLAASDEGARPVKRPVTYWEDSGEHLALTADELQTVTQAIREALAERADPDGREDVEVRHKPIDGCDLAGCDRVCHYPGKDGCDPPILCGTCRALWPCWAMRNVYINADGEPDPRHKQCERTDGHAFHRWIKATGDGASVYRYCHGKGSRGPRPHAFEDEVASAVWEEAVVNGDTWAMQDCPPVSGTDCPDFRTFDPDELRANMRRQQGM